jgi:hypothetical protein
MVIIIQVKPINFVKEFINVAISLKFIAFKFIITIITHNFKDIIKIVIINVK